MAERLHKNPDVPNFGTFLNEPILLEHATAGNGKAGLEEKARQVGQALGRMVVTLREAGDTLKDIGSESRELAAIRINRMAGKAREAGSRITGMAGAIKNKAAQWGETAASNAEELRRASAERAREVRSRVRTGYFRARLRANQTVREYPMQVVLVAGAVGFLLGAGLRIWRSSREY